MMTNLRVFNGIFDCTFYYARAYILEDYSKNISSCNVFGWRINLRLKLIVRNKRCILGFIQLNRI